MATTPMVPSAGNPNLDGNPPAAAPLPPGTDMTGICFRDQLWLNSYPLDRNLVFDYFALSPFYDWTCNNEYLRARAIHPLDVSQLSKMTGFEYMLNEVMEPHLFVFRKQKRDGPEKVTPMLTYYVLDGSIYQAPQLCNVFASLSWQGIVLYLESFYYCCLKAGEDWIWNEVHLKKTLKLKFVWPMVAITDADGESTAPEPKVAKETIDFKEVKRIDHILAQLQRKLPPAPLPPPFPEGYAPPQTAEGGITSEPQQAAETQAPPVDPIIDQGPAKRMRV